MPNWYRGKLRPCSFQSSLVHVLQARGLSSTKQTTWMKLWAELANTSDTLKRSNPGLVFLDSSRRNVFRMHDTVIKFGHGVDAREAQTTQFIEKLTNIPVPHATSDGQNAVVMDYVDGCNLEDCWPKMSHEGKQRIANEMRSILQRLRGLKGHYIGAVNRGPAVDARKSTRIGGPSDSELDFNRFLLDNMISSTPLLFFESLQQTMRRDHELLLSHRDLNLHNIIVKDGRIVALLDWEYAGWYPEYWEFVKFCAASLHEREWHEFGQNFSPITYPEDLIKDQFMLRSFFRKPVLGHPERCSSDGRRTPWRYY